MNVCWNKLLNSFPFVCNYQLEITMQITREQISTKSWFNKKANNIPAEIFKAEGANALDAFWTRCSAKHMEQRGYVWRLSKCSHCCSLQQQGEQLWKLQRHLTSFCNGNDLYPRSPKPTDHGNWKRSPRGTGGFRPGCSTVDMILSSDRCRRSVLNRTRPSSLSL